MASATPFQTESANLLRSGIAGLGGTTAAFNPASAQPFMNQYEDAAVQQALSDIARQGQIAQQGVAAQAVGAGAFGGSRSAIAEQELQRNILDQQGRTAAQMRAAGFESAAQRAQAAFEAQQGRAQQAAQLTGALGQGIGALGTQYGALGLQQGEALGSLGLRQSALGELQQQLGQREQGFLFDLGKTQQAQQQAELEAARQSQLQQLYEPYQRLGFLSDIYKGAPSTQQTLAAVTAPTASTAQQILGLGVAGLSAATGVSRSGLSDDEQRCNGASNVRSRRGRPAFSSWRTSRAHAGQPDGRRGHAYNGHVRHRAAPANADGRRYGDGAAGGY